MSVEAPSQMEKDLARSLFSLGNRVEALLFSVFEVNTDRVYQCEVAHEFVREYLPQNADRNEPIQILFDSAVRQSFKQQIQEELKSSDTDFVPKYLSYFPKSSQEYNVDLLVKKVRGAALFLQKTLDESFLGQHFLNYGPPRIQEIEEVSTSEETEDGVVIDTTETIELKKKAILQKWEQDPDQMRAALDPKIKEQLLCIRNEILKG